MYSFVVMLLSPVAISMFGKSFDYSIDSVNLVRELRDNSTFMYQAFSPLN